MLHNCYTNSEVHYDNVTSSLILSPEIDTNSLLYLALTLFHNADRKAVCFCTAVKGFALYPYELRALKEATSMIVLSVGTFFVKG